MKIQDRLYDYHFNSVQAIGELDKNEEIDISHLVYGTEAHQQHPLH